MKQTDNFKFDEANVMNELVYRNLSEDAKRQICAWKYGGEYDLYNLPSYEEMQVRQIGFMNPQREKNYYGFPCLYFFILYYTISTIFLQSLSRFSLF